MASDFDERAATWDDDPKKAERARRVADAIRREVELTSTTRLFEYGAGTALLAEALADDVGPITLAEPSSGMRDVIGEKLAAGRLPAGTRVWDVDLSTDEVPDERFDLIASVMVLHHIPDLAPALAALARLVEPGGRVCIVDLEDEDGSFHANRPAFDGHDGFDRAELTAMLETAGLTDVRFSACGSVEKSDRTYPLFLATCTIP